MSDQFSPSEHVVKSQIAEAYVAAARFPGIGIRPTEAGTFDIIFVGNPYYNRPSVPLEWLIVEIDSLIFELQDKYGEYGERLGDAVVRFSINISPSE